MMPINPFLLSRNQNFQITQPMATAAMAPRISRAGWKASPWIGPKQGSRVRRRLLLPFVLSPTYSFVSARPSLLALKLYFDAQLMRFLNEYADVMADQLAEYLIDHRDGRLAAHMIAEFGLDH
jgi:hypothetical protein